MPTSLLECGEDASLRVIEISGFDLGLNTGLNMGLFPAQVRMDGQFDQEVGATLVRRELGRRRAVGRHRLAHDGDSRATAYEPIHATKDHGVDWLIRLAGPATDVGELHGQRAKPMKFVNARGTRVRKGHRQNPVSLRTRGRA